MRARLHTAVGAIVVALAGLAAMGCGTKAPAITGVTVTVTFPASLGVDQLAFDVSSGATVIKSATRPETAGDTLMSPQSVSIFLADGLANQDVTCTATPLAGGSAVAPGGSTVAHLALHALVPVRIDLGAGDAAAPGDGGGADGPPADAAGEASEDGPSDATRESMPVTDATPSDDAVEAGGLKTLGVACGSGAECESTLCVDGVCCGSACNGTCESCDQRGSEGECAPLPLGTPTTECVNQGAATCGFDGTCDGNGGCRRYAEGTPCKAASCQTSTLVPASACDGKGACMEPSSIGCAPYLCDTSTGTPQCRTTCQVGAGGVGCAAPAVCTAGSCGAKVLKGNGDGCAAAGDCLSNHCVDGVCCATACTAACMTCALAGAAGTCLPVAMGAADPRGVCKDAGATLCKQNGLCNGAGACALYPASTTCFGGACSGRMVLAVRHCDGAGVCAAGTDVDCGNYRCNPATTTCYTSCTSNAQCANAPKRTCNGNNMCQ